MTDTEATELRRLESENDALRKLLSRWYYTFADLRKPSTEGAILIDLTHRALTTTFQYKT